MENTGQSIAARLRERRLALGYSYQTLSDLTGIGRSTLQRYESGRIAGIPLKNLEPLAAALGVAPEWLLGLREEDPGALPRLMAQRYGQPGGALAGALETLSPDGVREAARRVCELACLPQYRQQAEEDGLWQRYAGRPMAARGGGVQTQDEQRARRALRLEQYLRAKGELK